MKAISRRLAVMLSICLGVAIAHAQSAFVSVSAYPKVALADGNSTVDITALVRLSNGQLAPDGTRLFFTSTLGQFSDTTAQTVNGFAHSALHVGAIPGVAKVTVSVPTYAATSVQSVELVSDASLLSSATDYMELVSSSFLTMSLDTRIVAAAAPGKGAHFQYRDMFVDADDLEFNLPTMELRAKRARVRLGKFDSAFEDVLIRLEERRGSGTLLSTVEEAAGVIPEFRWFRFAKREVTKLRLVDFDAAGMRDHDGLDDVDFEFSDTSSSPTYITCRKAVVLPQRSVQFERAEIVVGGRKMFHMPLYQLDLTSSEPTLFGNQVVTVNDSKLAVNYPVFLTLKPGSSSLLRLRTGDDYGARGIGGAAAVNLDYELSWMHGDKSEGGLQVTGFNRSDYSVSLRHRLSLSSHSALSGQVELPAHRSIYTGVNFNQSFKGYSMVASQSYSHALSGVNVDNQRVDFALEKNGSRLSKRVPIDFYPGITATYLRVYSGSSVQKQNSLGFRLRSLVRPIRFGTRSTLNITSSISRLVGEGVKRGFTTQLSASLSRSLSKHAGMGLGYDYFDDPISSKYVGRHRISAQGYFSGGRTSLSALIGKSIDAKRMNSAFDLGYRLTGVWRLTFSHTYNLYEAAGSTSYNIGLGYMLGMREIGLVWSNRTKRIGLQLLGNNF